MNTPKHIEATSPKFGKAFIEIALSFYAKNVLKNPDQFKWGFYPKDEFQRISKEVIAYKDKVYKEAGIPEVIRLSPEPLPVNFLNDEQEDPFAEEKKMFKFIHDTNQFINEVGEEIVTGTAPLASHQLDDADQQDATDLSKDFNL